jgi:hypothetical protein
MADKPQKPSPPRPDKLPAFDHKLPPAREIHKRDVPAVSNTFKTPVKPPKP